MFNINKYRTLSIVICGKYLLLNIGSERWYVLYDKKKTEQTKKYVDVFSFNKPVAFMANEYKSQNSKKRLYTRDIHGYVIQNKQINAILGVQNHRKNRCVMSRNRKTLALTTPLCPFYRHH